MSFTDGVKNVPRLPNGGSDLIGVLTTVIDPSPPFRMTLNIPLIMTPFPPIVILNGGKNTVWKKREME